MHNLVFLLPLPTRELLLMNALEPKKHTFFCKKILPCLILLLFFFFLQLSSAAAATIAIVRSVSVPDQYQFKARQPADCTENYFAAKEDLILDHPGKRLG